MKRAEVEKLLKNRQISQIDIVLKETDKLAIYCKISGGKLKNYNDRVVCGLKDDIWGYLEWSNGKSIRKAF